VKLAEFEDHLHRILRMGPNLFSLLFRSSSNSQGMKVFSLYTDRGYAEAAALFIPLSFRPKLWNNQLKYRKLSLNESET
jgi:hypothetical protein